MAILQTTNKYDYFSVSIFSAKMLLSLKLNW